jgi:WS/DGAT/MGAT family acyltransferase
MVARVDRISPTDLTQLATDVGPVPMNVGALLVLDDADLNELRQTLLRRLPLVDRFRQVLRSAPPGLGRPYWVADPFFVMERHLTSLTLRGPIDDARLATIAAEEVARPLASDRPLWRAVVVARESEEGSERAAAGSAVAVVLVMHHVLADGIGGLAVLLGLVDGAGDVTPLGEHAPSPGPTPEPDRRTLLADAWAERVRTMRGLPSTLAALRGARAELGTARTGRRDHGPGPEPPGEPPTTRRRGAAACSINAPTGPRRAVHLAEVDLARLRTAGRSQGATVNDCLLVAVTGALEHLLHIRGECPDSLVVSVPISARRSTSSADLGNQVGVMPVRVELRGDAGARLARVAAETSARKSAPGSSLALVGPLFRAAAAVGAFGWLVNRQRLVNTFLTNLRGPADSVHLAGTPVTRIVPVTITAGNVGVAFAALSYAGRLGVTVITDPDVVPEGEELARALDIHLAAIAG